MSEDTLNLNDIKNNMSELEKEEVKCDVENLELYSDTHPFRLSLRIKTFESEAEYNKFIRNVETTIRRSIEYKMWKGYIIDVLGIKTCMITNERIDECSIEVHHHLPSLFTVVKAIVNKKIENKEEFSTFDISLEAIELHFQNKIGYATLIKSMHEKFHNGFLSIPRELVKGDYMYFVNEYSKYLDESDLEVINMRLATNVSNCEWTRDNYLATMSHLQRVSSLLSTSQENFEARELHATHWGRLCPIESPEGKNIGLRKNLSLFSEITPKLKKQVIVDAIKSLENLGLNKEFKVEVDSI